MVILGGFVTSEEAHQEGFKGYPGDFDVELFDTVSKQEAVSRFKALDVKKGKTIDEALRYRTSELP